MLSLNATPASSSDLASSSKCSSIRRPRSSSPNTSRRYARFSGLKPKLLSFHRPVAEEVTDQRRDGIAVVLHLFKRRLQQATLQPPQPCRVGDDSLHRGREVAAAPAPPVGVNACASEPLRGGR